MGRPVRAPTIEVHSERHGRDQTIFDPCVGARVLRRGQRARLERSADRVPFDVFPVKARGRNSAHLACQLVHNKLQ